MTGMLIFLGNLFRSIWEGKEDKLSPLYSKIAEDQTGRRIELGLINRKMAILLIGLSLFLPTQTLLAHRAPEGLTTIERNPNTGGIEITHRFHIHDAEHALQEFLGDSDLTIDSLKGKAQLALHVESSFQIADSKTGQPIELNLIGAQIEGDQILVFQEYTAELPSALKVRHDALREEFPQQVNTVNVRLNSHIRTLVFKGTSKWKILEK